MTIAIGPHPNTFYRVSLKAIIRHPDGRLLVVREGSHESFTLPGGGIDHGETAIECLKRELFEEVAYRGDLQARPCALETLWMEEKQAWLMWVIYEVTPDNYHFSLGEDGVEMAYVDPRIFKDSTAPAEQLIYKYCA